MINPQRQYTLTLQFLLDLLVVVTAWMVSYPLRFYSGLFDLRISHIPHFQNFAFMGLLVLLVWVVHLRSSKLYGEKTVPSFSRETLLVIRTHFLAFVTFVVIVFFIGSYRPSRLVFAIFLTLSTVGLIFSHAAFRQMLIYQRKRGKGLRKVIVVGVGDLGREVAQRILNHRELGLKLVGFLSDSENSEEQTIEGLPVLGTSDDVQTVIREKGIHQVFVALPLHAADRLAKVVKNVSDEVVDVKVIPDLIQYVTLRAGVEEFEGLPVISLVDSPISGWNALAKRVFDLSATLAAAPLLIPLAVILSVGVKLSSPGPILYKQKRMGLDGRTFNIYKFRSMPVNAEKKTGAVWATKSDNRATRFGAFIRKFNLDEIPQLYNVLQGRMSLVGPRPERPIFIEKFRDEIPKYMLRHKVRAGLTGWAQVNGWRGNTDLGKRIECDLYYIQNWSLGFDLYIIWLTFVRSFRDENAY